MNKLIKDLAKQVINASPEYLNSGTLVMIEKEWSKFAELIVRECADIAAEDSETVGDRIKQYFGIE